MINPKKMSFKSRKIGESDKKKKSLTGSKCYKCGSPAIQDGVMRDDKLVSVCSNH